MAARAVTSVESSGGAPVTVTLLGRFRIAVNGKEAGPWARPSAKRLCQMLMVHPDHRLVRDVAREMLFANLEPDASANAMRKALSMARDALAPLGEGASGLLRADRDVIWVADGIPLDIDLVRHENAVRSALNMEPGDHRDAALVDALMQNGALLDDELYAEWAWYRERLSNCCANERV